MIRTTEIAWVAGLLEGEGSFLVSGRSIAVMVRMCDRDVIERAGQLLNGYIYGPLKRQTPHYQPQFRAQVKGPAAAGWMMTLYPLLGVRRRDQVRTALRQWRAMPYVCISPLVERAIVDAWDSGMRNKVRLGRACGVSRPTVYNVLARNQRFYVREELRRRVTAMEIAWLAGLLEGEGSVSINGRSCTVRVKMTDHDVVARAADILGARIYDDGIRRTGLKQIWTAQVKGTLAAGWAMTLYPWFGVRRRGQVRHAITHWRTQGHGVISTGLEDSIRRYRQAGYSQADIMELLGVSKSTVYRHTKGHVRRMRVCTRRIDDGLGEVREPFAAYAAAGR